MTELFLFILTPPVIAGILHMLVVKANWFSGLAEPIHKGLFGVNKTWRGLVVVSLANACLSVLVNVFTIAIEAENAFWYGLLFGIAYMLAELPNSCYKRSLGIAPGKSSESYPWLFKLVDKVDSAAALSIVATFIFSLSMELALLLFVLGSTLHALFSVLLVAGSVKKSF